MIRHPLPPLTYLASFQLKGTENPQSLIAGTYRGQLRRRAVTQRREDSQVSPASGELPAPVSHGGSEMGKQSKQAQEEDSSGSGGHADAFLTLLSHLETTACSCISHEDVQCGWVDIYLCLSPSCSAQNIRVFFTFIAGAIPQLACFISMNSSCIRFCQQSALGLFSMKSTM